MGVTFLSVFFFGAGLLFLFWPEQMRDWLLKSYVKVGFTKPIFMQKMMFSAGSILAFRFAGILAILVSGLLFWFHMRGLFN